MFNNTHFICVFSPCTYMVTSRDSLTVFSLIVSLLSTVSRGCSSMIGWLIELDLCAEGSAVAQW